MQTFYTNWYFLLQVEVGDVILEVNNTDVNRFSTKEGNNVYFSHSICYAPFIARLHRIAFLFYVC